MQLLVAVLMGLHLCATVLSIDVSLTLEHDLGQGFKKAGTMRTTLEEGRVRPGGAYKVDVSHQHVACTGHALHHATYHSNGPTRLQLANNARMKLEWDVSDDALQALRKLAADDGCVL
jgi:hypothetical protein